MMGGFLTSINVFNFSIICNNKLIIKLNNIGYVLSLFPVPEYLVNLVTSSLLSFGLYILTSSKALVYSLEFSSFNFQQ